MCGIIGYVGPRECKPLLLHGLERLEYRGYDSAGIALLEDGGLTYTRAVGNLQNLRARAGDTPSPATTGLGHTRWATHGGVTEENAHPLAAEEPRSSPSCSTGSSRTTASCASGSATPGTCSPPRPTPRPSPT